MCMHARAHVGTVMPGGGMCVGGDEERENRELGNGWATERGRAGEGKGGGREKGKKQGGSKVGGRVDGLGSARGWRGGDWRARHAVMT